jgi:hypothetical protein
MKIVNLTAEKVNKTFMYCLFKEGESTDNYIIGQGVMMKVGFNPERLKESEPVIMKMLNNLPEEFKKTGGGGMSFLYMCNDKDGKQWADLHETMDQLVVLGNAIGKLTFLMPKEMWSVLPGGMPYLVVS